MFRCWQLDSHSFSILLFVIFLPPKSVPSTRTIATTMSSINIATLPRMSRDALSTLLLSTSTPSNLAIVDVRDSGKPLEPTHPSSSHAIPSNKPHQTTSAATSAAPPGFPAPRSSYASPNSSAPSRTRKPSSSTVPSASSVARLLRCAMRGRARAL